MSVFAFIFSVVGLSSKLKPILVFEQFDESLQTYLSRKFDYQKQPLSQQH